MGTHVREAIVEDYEDLCELFAEADGLHRRALPRVFREPDGACRTREYVAKIVAAEDQALLVAERDEGVVGCAHILIARASDIPIMVPRRFLVIDNIVVRKDSRRQGVGRLLLERAEQWALARGADMVELNVWEFNTGARLFYQALGYETASHKMWKQLPRRDGSKKQTN